MFRNPLNHPSVLFKKEDILRVGSYRDIKFFEDYDIIITPAASVPPFNHEDEYPKNIDSKIMDNYLKWEAISYGVTLFGGPSIVIPCGSIENGLPFGLQLISKKKGE